MSVRIILFALFVLLPSGPASAVVEWDIQCDAAQAEFAVTVDIFNQYIQEGDVSGYELLFEQSEIGACDAPEVFMTVPLHAPLTWAEYTFTRPVPEADLYHRFRVLMRRPDGTVYDVGFPGAPSWTAASCGEAVAVRGYIESVDEYGYATVVPCPAACEAWPCTYAVDLRGIPEDQWRPLVGAQVAVDIYGQYNLYPMAGGPCLIAESWLPTAGGDCGPVPTRRESWGGLKALYR